MFCLLARSFNPHSSDGYGRKPVHPAGRRCALTVPLNLGTCAGVKNTTKALIAGVLDARLSLCLPLVAALVACGDSDRAVKLLFAGKVGDVSFSCDQSFSDLGIGNNEVQFSDFRLYLSDVRLVDGAGMEVPIALEQDGIWQQGGLALLDYEDGTGSCANGTQPTRTEVIGTVPEGEYVGLRFQVGVPFLENHEDASLADSPLNLTAMFWSWNDGYKFIRVDGATLATETQTSTAAVRVHLGSTGCDGDQAGNVTTCAAPNRVDIDLTAVNIDSDVVVFDLATLFEASDLGAPNAPSTPPGCMSSPTDPDCAPIFQRLGLPWGDSPGGNPAFVRVESQSGL
jgi:uncharacterized repeat protein (TIGR04052 family)